MTFSPSRIADVATTARMAMVAAIRTVLGLRRLFLSSILTDIGINHTAETAGARNARFIFKCPHVTMPCFCGFYGGGRSCLLVFLGMGLFPQEV